MMEQNNEEKAAVSGDPIPVNRQPGWDAAAAPHMEILMKLGGILAPILTIEQFQQYQIHAGALNAEVLKILRYPTYLRDAPAAPADLEALKALALAAKDDAFDVGLPSEAAQEFMEKVSPAVVLALIDRIAALEALRVGQQAVPTLPANVKLAGVKMANTMFNLAQRCGELIDSSLCSKMDAMRKEWDSALLVSFGSGLQEKAAPEQKPVTLTLTGHQLRMALDLINPDGPSDDLQMDDELTFGIVQHKDDDGKVSTGMCCWNGDTDGVLPLDGEYRPEVSSGAPSAEDVRDAAFDEVAAWYVDKGWMMDEDDIAPAIRAFKSKSGGSDDVREGARHADQA